MSAEGVVGGGEGFTFSVVAALVILEGNETRDMVVDSFNGRLRSVGVSVQYGYTSEDSTSGIATPTTVSPSNIPAFLSGSSQVCFPSPFSFPLFSPTLQISALPSVSPLEY